MKNIFTIALSVLSLSAFAQKTPEQIADAYFPKNEIKVNVIYPFWGMAEISYERHLNEHSSIGASAFLDFKQIRDTFFFSPYYRYYFGKKPNQGFYMEGQLIFATSDDANLFSAESDNGKMLFGVGAGAGYKLMLKNNWFIDGTVSAGTFVNKGAGFYFRPGLSFGKRF